MLVQNKLGLQLKAVKCRTKKVDNYVPDEPLVLPPLNVFCCLERCCKEFEHYRDYELGLGVKMLFIRKSIQTIGEQTKKKETAHSKQ